MNKPSSSQMTDYLYSLISRTLSILLNTIINIGLRNKMLICHEIDYALKEIITVKSDQTERSDLAKRVLL